VLPASNPAIVHEHEAAVAERVAVAVREVALGGGANMGEDKGRGRFRRETFEVDAVPCGNGGGKDTGLWA
jgi:hypothetical protein